MAQLESNSSKNTLDTLLRKPAMRLVMFVIATLLVAGCVILYGFAWWYVIPALWRWGTIFSISETPWDPWLLLRVIPSVTGIFVFTLFGWMPLVFAPLSLLSRVLRSFARAAEDEELAERDKERLKLENQLKDLDSARLVPLMQYSHGELEAYYRMGLSQMRFIFVNSVIAMWMGFVVILAGIIYQVFPIWQNVKDPEYIRYIAVAGGIVIEVIAGLFLWVYRISARQLTYYYNRQFQIHNIVFCHRMALTPDTNSRSMVEEIINHVLEHTWKESDYRPAPPSGKNPLRRFVRTKRPVVSSPKSAQPGEPDRSGNE